MNDDYGNRYKAALDKIDSKAQEFTKESVAKIYFAARKELKESGVDGEAVDNALKQLAAEVMWRACAAEFQSIHKEELVNLTKEIYKEFGLEEYSTGLNQSAQQKGN